MTLWCGTQIWIVNETGTPVSAQIIQPINYRPREPCYMVLPASRAPDLLVQYFNRRVFNL